MEDGEPLGRPRGLHTQRILLTVPPTVTWAEQYALTSPPLIKEPPTTQKESEDRKKPKGYPFEEKKTVASLGGLAHFAVLVFTTASIPFFSQALYNNNNNDNKRGSCL